MLLVLGIGGLLACGSPVETHTDGGTTQDAAPAEDASVGSDGSTDAGVETPIAPLIVLVPAFHATIDNSWSLVRIQEVLEADGHRAYLASLPPYASTPARAAVLVMELDRIRRQYCSEERPELNTSTCFEETRVHLIGHSQGGLDARHAVSNLGYGDATLSVTTLSSPHRGTPLGDVGLTLLGDPRAERSVGAVLTAALRELLDNLIGTAETVEGLSDAFYWLSETRYQAQLEGREVVSEDVAGVHYQSWAGVATGDGALPDVSACEGRTEFATNRAAELRGVSDAAVFGTVSRIFEAEHVPNDGHIPVLSAKYGMFHGCLPVDHLDLIGRPESQTDENRILTGFDYQVFYRDLGRGLRLLTPSP